MSKGVVSAGHELTAKAGIDILEAGGNAFDAALAAVFASFVCESALTGIGGGGFFMAHSGKGETLLYDYVPNVSGIGRHGGMENIEFYPVYMDFTDTKQEFHVGRGSAAVPGSMAGMAEIHKRHCTLPLEKLVAPAVKYGRDGIPLNSQQAYFNSILSSILTASEEGRAIYAPEGQLLEAGDRIFFKDMADTMEKLAHEGLDSFYKGELAKGMLSEFGGESGLITDKDINNYKVHVRIPLEIDYRGRKIYTNPPPSSGGCLIAFSLLLLSGYDFSRFGHNSCAYLNLLFEVMKVTASARGNDFDHRIYEEGITDAFLSDEMINKYKGIIGDDLESLGSAVMGSGNTTHISVLDEDGNAASVTNSNGEGSGVYIPGTGVMLNNMLGEEDINPRGFHKQEAGVRLSSMMAPTIVMKEGTPEIVLGSGGSNRIRNAVLQVMLNLIDHGLGVDEAVNSARCHWDGEVFHAEKGMNPHELDLLEKHGVNSKRWGQQNMYFGGVHTVGMDSEKGSLFGAGDLRRGGVCLFTGS